MFNMKRIMIILFIGLILFLGYKSEPKLLLFIKYPQQYKEHVFKYSDLYQIEDELIFSIIKAESNFYPYAKSKKDAKGLMQIIDKTWSWGCSELESPSMDYYNIEDNIKVGTWYLRRLINEFGSEELAVLAYNAGSGNVNAWISKGYLSDTDYTKWEIPFEESKTYINKVMSYKNKYALIYE